MKIDKFAAESKEPLYLRLTEDVLEQIHSGTLKPGDRLPSISELRKRHGLCKQTIERAHLLLEQKGVVVRRQGIGTFVTEAAEVKASRGVIGFVGLYSILEDYTPEYSRTYISLVLEGIHEVTNPLGIQMMLFDPEDPNIFDKADGIFVNGSYSKVQQRWHDEKLPCVALMDPTQYAELSSVAGSRYEAACLVTQHLIDLGHRKIAYLHNTEDVARYHYNGFLETMKAAGIKIKDGWVRGFEGPMVNFYRPGRKNMKAWLDEGFLKTGCTAVVAPNEETAIAVIDTLHEAGWKVPEDFSVVGMDDAEPNSNLTTAALPLREVGRRGAELLLKQIEQGVEEFEHIVLSPHLLVRGTSAPPAG